MRKQYVVNFALLLSLATGLPVVAQADDGSAAVAQLAQMDQPFHSRTCGLVLLSDGRAQVRAVKVAGTGEFTSSRTQLIKAFLLLRDGRGLQVSLELPRQYFWQRLSTGEGTTPRFQPLPVATAHCEQWLETRRAQSDFDISEDAQQSAVAQADLTLKTE